MCREWSGESKHANIGISLPGTGEDPKAPVYIDGKLAKILQGETLIAEFTSILEDYVESHYSAVQSLNRIPIRTRVEAVLMYLNTFV